MGRPRAEALSKIHHVVQRGNGHRLIFEEDHDRNHFLYNLKRFSEQYDVVLLAWCLMDNHIHLLLEGEISSIASFMRALSLDYAQYFNDRYDCNGHLFQGRYLSEPVNTDEYLLAAIRYIHCNPTKAGLASAWNYRWSSYSEYVDHPVLCNVDKVLKILGGVNAFEAFHRNAAPEHYPHRFLEDDIPAQSNDETLVSFAIEVLDEKTFRNIKALSKPERTEALSKLRRRGLSIRQIERLTGISRGIIGRSVM